MWQPCRTVQSQGDARHAGAVLCTPPEPVPRNASPQEPQGSSCLELAVPRETSDWGRGEVTLKGGIQKAGGEV